MRIEMRNLGVDGSERLELEAERALGAALRRFDARVRQVRVRFVPTGAQGAVCRVRVWCGRGPTVVVEAPGASGAEAAHSVADTLNRALRNRWSGRRARALHAGGSAS